MKEFRITFETAKLDVYDMCEIVKYATAKKCDISFCGMNVLMHIDCDSRPVSRVLRYFKELFGA